MEKIPASGCSSCRKMLERTPNDPFLLYGVALEFKKANEPVQALNYLAKTIAADPGYCYAYFQRGQVHELLGEMASAKSSYLEGIEVAAKKGDAHARSELEGALSMIE